MRAFVLGLLAALVLPAAAHAWTVTVHVHGAGQVQEVTNRLGGNRNQLSCIVGPSGKSNTSVTDCVGGTASGLYNSGDVVRIQESVPTGAFDRGWRFDHWTDGTASGQINCDPQDTTGDFSSPDYCEFQIFQNLSVDLYFHDSVGPSDTRITGGPTAGSTVGGSSQTLTYDAPSDPDATFQCQLTRPGQAGPGFAACPLTGKTYSDLTTDGTYVFGVRGVDPSGNVGNTVIRSWTRDTTGPNLQVTGGPAEGATVNTSTADFTVTTDEGSPSCSLDGAVSACSGAKQYTNVPDGSHTLTVTAKDSFNNQTVVTRHWTVDTVAPSVTLTGGPAEGSTVTSRTASFTVGTSEGTPTCTVDTTPISCTGGTVTVSDLADGAHTVTVVATDAVGNQGTAARHWTVTTASATPTVTATATATATTEATATATTAATATATAIATATATATPVSKCPAATATLKAATRTQTKADRKVKAAAKAVKHAHTKAAHKRAGKALSKAKKAAKKAAAAVKAAIRGVTAAC